MKQIQNKLYAVLFTVTISCIFTSCFSPISGDDIEETEAATRSEVIIRHQAFNFYQDDYGTRAALSDESNANINAITTYIYDGDNEEAFSETQFRKDFTSNPEDFGVFSTKLPAGNYRLVSVGYNSESSSASFVAQDVVNLPAPLIDAWSVSQEFTVASAGSVNLQPDLKLAVARIALTSTDLPTEDAVYVEICLPNCDGQKFNPITQAAINTATDGNMHIQCTVANFLNSEGKFQFERSFFLPSTPVEMAVTFKILDSNRTAIRSYTLNGPYSFKRGGINRFAGPVFSAVGDFAFTATTNWEENENVSF